MYVVYLISKVVDHYENPRNVGSFDKSDASDWMIIDDGYLIGGYTILALRDQMPEAEQKEFDASFPYKTKKQ